MAALGDRLSRFFGRVEILARGAEPHLKAAEIALDKGDPLDARAHARALLSRVPKSPLGLALWADAAEACGFPEEVVTALEQLAAQAPWQQEIWLRLGKAGLASDWPKARFALERAAAGRDAPAVTREALLTLADLDMADEPARARHWLARIPQHLSQRDAPLALRQAECAIALGRWDEAKPWIEQATGLDEQERDALGGRLRLVRARAAQRFPDAYVGSDPMRLCISAFVLGTPDADRLLVQLVAETDDAALVALARDAVDALGELSEPRYKAAFAIAEGRREDARAALVEAAGKGDDEAAASLASHAIRWQDMVALTAVSECSRDLVPKDAALLLEASEELAAGHDELALALVERAWQMGGEAKAWAETEVRRVIARWLPDDGESDWDRVWRELRRIASQLERSDLAPRIEALAVERDRPLYVAILGEFNAGKSTLINALLSTDVAPTGIRPTTATLHWVAWAPDPFARVVVRGRPDRVVMHDDLKATLAEIQSSGGQIERVFIYAPVERLKRIEILDTPGFNAPDVSHAEEARRGIEEAHVALWLLDATAPLKDSERQVIEKIGEAGVPLQVLVNKRDRLAVPELEKVMKYIETSLQQTGIESLAPPVAMSAQRALAGRLGDADALESSGWPEVERVLAEHIVNVADALRERALRRKTARVAAALADTVAQRNDLDRTRRVAARDRAHAQALLSGLLRSELPAIVDEIFTACEPTLRELDRDMIPIDQLADERRSDPEVRRYVIERTSERLAKTFAVAIAASLRKRAGVAELDTVAVTDAARAVLAGAAAAFRGRPPLRDEALRDALTVAVGVAAERLDVDADAKATETEDLGAGLRIQAMAEALQKVATPTSK